jgi:hypothetical protein
LLRIAAGELRRLSRRAPVVVTARPAPRGERSGLMRLLEDKVDHVLLPDNQPEEIPSLARMASLWENVSNR